MTGFNGKVRLVDYNNYNFHTYKFNEIYEFKNGIMFDSNGDKMFYRTFKTYDDFTDFTTSKFELVI